jgi:hypothetical protein
MMVAYFYGQERRDEVSHLVMLDSPLPVTEMFAKLRVNPRIWQISFHAVLDIPEMLAAGRERQYPQAFYIARIFNEGRQPKETSIFMPRRMPQRGDARCIQPVPGF